MPIILLYVVALEIAILNFKYKFICIIKHVNEIILTRFYNDVNLNLNVD